MVTLHLIVCTRCVRYRKGSQYPFCQSVSVVGILPYFYLRSSLHLLMLPGLPHPVSFAIFPYTLPVESRTNTSFPSPAIAVHHALSISSYFSSICFTACTSTPVKLSTILSTPHLTSEKPTRHRPPTKCPPKHSHCCALPKHPPIQSIVLAVILSVTLRGGCAPVSHDRGRLSCVVRSREERKRLMRAGGGLR